MSLLYLYDGLILVKSLKSQRIWPNIQVTPGKSVVVHLTHFMMYIYMHCVKAALNDPAASFSSPARHNL